MDLQDAIEALQDLVDQGLLVVAERFLRLNDNGFAVEQGFEFREPVGAQRAAGRYQVANELGAPSFGAISTAPEK